MPTTATTPEDDAALADELYDMTGGRRASIPKPANVKLNGKDRIFTIDEYDQGSGEYATRPIAGETIDVTVLLVRSQIRWKFGSDENAPMVWSDEWDGNGKFQIVRIMQKFKGHPPTVQFTGTYEQMKEQFGTTDQMTGKTSYPWDYYVVLYAVLLDGTPDGKIVRIPIKGDSRSSWFDWNKEFHSGNPKMHLAQRIQRLGKSEEKKTASGAAYVSITFADIGVSSLGRKVVQMIKDLKDYFFVVEGEPRFLDRAASAPAATVIGGKMAALPIAATIERAETTDGAVGVSPSVVPLVASPVAPENATIGVNLDAVLARVGALASEKECDDAIAKVLSDATLAPNRASMLVSMIEGRRGRLRAEIDSIPF